MEFDRIKVLTAKEMVIKTIEEKIFSGELTIGEKLPPEREMASQFGVSRDNLRKALQELKRRGFIKVFAREGIYIADYKKECTVEIFNALMTYNSSELLPELLEDLLNFRQNLELGTTRLAAEKITDEQLEELRKIVNGIRFSKTKEEVSDGIVKFHGAIMDYSGNMVFNMFYHSLAPIVETLTLKYASLDDDKEKKCKKRELLIEALSEHNVDKSVECMKNVLSDGFSVLRKNYNVS